MRASSELPGLFERLIGAPNDWPPFSDRLNMISFWVEVWAPSGSCIQLTYTAPPWTASRGRRLAWRPVEIWMAAVKLWPPSNDRR